MSVAMLELQRTHELARVGVYACAITARAKPTDNRRPSEHTPQPSHCRRVSRKRRQRRSKRVVSVRAIHRLRRRHTTTVQRIRTRRVSDPSAQSRSQLQRLLAQRLQARRATQERLIGSQSTDLTTSVQVEHLSAGAKQARAKRQLLLARLLA